MKPHPELIHHFTMAKPRNMAEDYLEEAYRAGKIETIVIRPGYIIFGENDFTGIYQVLENIKLGRFGYINGGKPYVHLFMFKILWMELFMLGANLSCRRIFRYFRCDNVLERIYRIALFGYWSITTNF